MLITIPKKNQVPEMKQLAPSARLNWETFFDRDVYAADGHRCGTVCEVVQDSLTGQLYIRVRDDSAFRRYYYLPESTIGVVTQSRLLLDITSDKLSRFEPNRFNQRTPQFARPAARLNPATR